jgi:AcrR family transcriptional regulator
MFNDDEVLVHLYAIFPLKEAAISQSVFTNEHFLKSVHKPEVMMLKQGQDRRVQRTRELLQRAAMELITERGYDAITVGDITERANLGRTTFYLHYQNKVDLLLSGHDESFFKTTFEKMTVEDMFAEEASAHLVAIFEHAAHSREAYHRVIQGEDGAALLRGMREQFALSLEMKLRRWFNEHDSRIPFPILANYLAGSQLSLMGWWLEKRSPYSARQMAQTFQQMRRAVLRDALPDR